MHYGAALYWGGVNGKKFIVWTPLGSSDYALSKEKLTLRPYSYRPLIMTEMQSDLFFFYMFLSLCRVLRPLWQLFLSACFLLLQTFKILG